MNETQMQHGLDWNPDIDPAGWLASIKYDGCRAYWDGGTLWSRGGIAIRIPETWHAALPAGKALDGEIYDGLGGLTRCTQAVRFGRFTPSMHFKVFDAPAAPGNWIIRLASITGNAIVQPVEVYAIQNVAHLRTAFDDIQAIGGEGLMLRHPSLAYTAGYSEYLLKVKYPWQFERGFLSKA